MPGDTEGGREQARTRAGREAKHAVGRSGTSPRGAASRAREPRDFRVPGRWGRVLEGPYLRGLLNPKREVESGDEEDGDGQAFG